MKIIVIVPMLFISIQLLGWGQTGHRVVGEMAQKHLSELAEARINKILANQTLAEVSNWMDNVKSNRDYDSLRNWHWVTIPDGMTYEETEKNEEGDIIHGIEYIIEKLKTY